LQPGRYCFEVVIYSENADPEGRWYEVYLDRKLWGIGTTDHSRFREPTREEMSDLLTVKMAESSPWERS